MRVGDIIKIIDDGKGSRFEYGEVIYINNDDSIVVSVILWGYGDSSIQYPLYQTFNKDLNGDYWCTPTYYNYKGNYVKFTTEEFYKLVL